MAATRKLQAEIDRCLKKVAEGVDKFDETWQKVHHASNSNQKEKYEEDLKKEIKKLQRLRDQIKTWIASAEIKDKSVLYEKRKLIEAKMEKFKIVERETKTKAYSKEGLTSGQKLDPAERERADISQWLNTQLESLNIQIDQFEAEIESLGTTKKKKGRNDQAEQVEQLNSLLEKHRDHVQKLETLLRMLDNETVDINQIKDIKDDVEYYIDNCQDPDFTENEMIYDDIDGLEEMLLDPTLQTVGEVGHHANSVEASETMSTNSASSPIPYLHNHSNDTSSNDLSEKRRHKSSSEDSKVTSQSTSSSKSASITPAASQPTSSTTTTTTTKANTITTGSTTTTTIPASIITATSSVLNNKSSSVVNSIPPSTNLQQSVVSTSVTTPPATSSTISVVSPVASSGGLAALALASSTPIKGFTPNNSSPSSGALNGGGGGSGVGQPTSSNGPAAVAPLPPSNSNPASLASSAVTMAAVAVSGGSSHPSQVIASTVTGSVTATQLQQQSQPPRQEQQQQPNFAAAVQQLNGHASSLSEGRNVSTPPPSLQGSHKQLATSQSSHFSVAPMGSSITAAPSSTDTDGLPTLKSIAQEATNRAGLKVPLSQASTQQTQMSVPGSTAPSISQSGLFPTPQPKDRSQKTEAHIPPLMGVAPLGPVPLNKETQLQYAMLEAANQHMPHPSDSERLRPYLPRNPCPTPSYYPQLPPAQSDEIEFFLRLSTETLFFIFYYMEGTKAQYLAAKALKRQSWRFHTKYMMWFQRHEEPKIINDEYEQGTYIYFDFEKWGQRKKEGFTFEYRFLEDRDLD